MSQSIVKTFRTDSIVMALTLAAFGAPVLAQPTTHSVDVFFAYGNDMIEIGPEGQIFEIGPERHVFEGNMPTSGPLTRFTNLPGFASVTSGGLGIGPFDLMYYNVIGPLLYHDGAGFAPTTATLKGESLPRGVVEISSDTTVADGLRGLIGQADSIGDFHVDLGWQLSDEAAHGAYGVLLDLETDAPGIANSDPYFFVVNFGLDEIIFDGAVGQFTAVPGDITGDGVVDVGDLAAVGAQWGTAGSAADLNGDGVVGVEDLAIVGSNWSAAQVVAQSLVVPEPASLAVAGLGGLLVWTRRPWPRA